jgi:hypothetical protein
MGGRTPCSTASSSVRRQFLSVAASLTRVNMAIEDPVNESTYKARAARYEKWRDALYEAEGRKSLGRRIWERLTAPIDRTLAAVACCRRTNGGPLICDVSLAGGNGDIILSSLLLLRVRRPRSGRSCTKARRDDANGSCRSRKGKTGGVPLVFSKFSEPDRAPSRSLPELGKFIRA